MDEGILVSLKQRIQDLEEINKAHQEKNGMLRVEIQEKNKAIKNLKEKLGLDDNDLNYENPIDQLRSKGVI